jgi:hypothetical protein
MENVMQRVDHPSAWRPQNLHSDRSWILELDDRDRDELRAALFQLRNSGTAPEAVSVSDFALPRVALKLRRIFEEIEHGRGIAMLRGFPVSDQSLDDISAMFLGLGSHMGTRLSQTAEGIIVGHVSNLGYAYGKENVRGYYTRAKLQFHTDNADIVGLLCVRRAKSGGLSSVTSTISIWNEMVEHHSEELAQCLAGFHHSLKGENMPGVAPVTPHRVPVFAWRGGVLSSCFNTSYIEQGATLRGLELTPLERRTIDLINALAARDDLRLDFMSEPGDIQFINDHTTIHSRTEFVDDDDPALKRLMLRLWLKTPQGRLMADEMADRGYGPGSARNGVPYFREDAVKDPNSLRLSGAPTRDNKR